MKVTSTSYDEELVYDNFTFKKDKSSYSGTIIFIEAFKKDKIVQIGVYNSLI